MVNYEKIPRLDVFKSKLVQGARFGHTYEMPVLDKSEWIPKRALPFEKAMKPKDYCQWVHFYTHDVHFECVWKNPERYLPILRKFEGVITPDFSLYRELPLAMQIWNTYRNRAMAYWLQKEGIPIVPNVRWGDERTYTFAFEGIPKRSNVAISTNGCIRNKLDRFYFCKGLAKMIEVIEPAAIVNYSQTPGDIFGEWIRKGIPIYTIENYHDTIRKGVAS